MSEGELIGASSSHDQVVAVANTLLAPDEAVNDRHIYLR